MKEERSKVKSDILLRVRLLYVLFILAGAVVLTRIVWVQLFSREVAYNADRLSSRIFTREEIKAQRGSILSRDGEPLATSIFRYQAAFDQIRAIVQKRRPALYHQQAIQEALVTALDCMKIPSTAALQTALRSKDKARIAKAADSLDVAAARYFASVPYPIVPVRTRAT